jgi:hypothetical protein
LGEGPNWFLSMDQFLGIVNKVVRSKDSMFTGRNIHETGHPEDLMVIVMDITETVASTIAVLGETKSHMFEAPEK